MLLFLSPRFAMMLMVALPLVGGAMINPRGASAFLMGAWLGVLVAGPPLMLVLWVLGLRSLPQILAPLLKLPVLIALTVGFFYFSGVQPPLVLQGITAGLALWWARKVRLLF